MTGKERTEGRERLNQLFLCEALCLGGFDAETLTSGHANAIQKLFETDPSYFEIVQAAPPGPAAAHNLFIELPPDKGYDDKFVIGCFDCGKLIGVIDLIRDYRDEHHWFLGLLFLDPRRRGQGNGARIVRDLEEALRRAGGRRLGLAVIERNIRALKFWQCMGFDEERRSECSIGMGPLLPVVVLGRTL
jgi:GNAT superfamily N-acetyltransferase